MTSKRTMATSMGGRITTTAIDEVVSLHAQETAGIGGAWMILHSSEAIKLVQMLSVAIAFTDPGVKRCEWCRTAFVSKRKRARFCGKKCRSESAHPRVGRGRKKR